MDKENIWEIKLRRTSRHTSRCETTSSVRHFAMLRLQYVFLLTKVKYEEILLEMCRMNKNGPGLRATLSLNIALRRIGTKLFFHIFRAKTKTPFLASTWDSDKNYKWRVFWHSKKTSLRATLALHIPFWPNNKNIFLMHLAQRHGKSFW